MNIAIQVEFRRLGRSEITCREFLSRVVSATKSLVDSKKSGAEAVFNAIAEFSHEREPLRPDCFLALLGMIGVYDWPGIHHVMSMQTAPSFQGFSISSWTVHSPEPKPWCFFAVEDLPVTDIVRSVDLKELFGHVHAEHVTTGLREAAERVFHSGSFSWLRLVPLLSHLGIMPRFPGRKWLKSAGKARLAAEFEKAADDVEALVRELLLTQKSVRRRDADEDGGKGEGEGRHEDEDRDAGKVEGQNDEDMDEDASFASPATTATSTTSTPDSQTADARGSASGSEHLRWFEALIAYAPSIESLASLLDRSVTTK
jgi:hypothetical protein